jgi:hypothetical protein
MNTEGNTSEHGAFKDRIVLNEGVKFCCYPTVLFDEIPPSIFHTTSKRP